MRSNWKPLFFKKNLKLKKNIYCRNFVNFDLYNLNSDIRIYNGYEFKFISHRILRKNFKFGVFSFTKKKAVFNKK